MPPRKKELKVILKLTPQALERFSPVTKVTKPSVSEQPSSPDPSLNPILSSAPSPSDAPAQSQNATPAPNEASNAATPAGASESTPAPSSLQVPSNSTQRRQGKPGPKPGMKRGPQLLENGMPKPRGKPGPKKKPRPGEPGAETSAFSIVAPLNAPKLGPKANLGAINAGLRALDRTGKPTRKWKRQPFSLKSFTGVNWSVPVWQAPKKAAIDGEELKADISIGDMRRGSDAGDVTMMDVSEVA